MRLVEPGMTNPTPSAARSRGVDLAVLDREIQSAHQALTAAGIPTHSEAGRDLSLDARIEILLREVERLRSRYRVCDEDVAHAKVTTGQAIAWLDKHGWMVDPESTTRRKRCKRSTARGLGVCYIGGVPRPRVDEIDDIVLAISEAASVEGLAELAVLEQMAGGDPECEGKCFCGVPEDEDEDEHDGVPEDEDEDEDEHDGSTPTAEYPAPWTRDQTANGHWVIYAANGVIVRDVIGDDADAYSERLVAESIEVDRVLALPGDAEAADLEQMAAFGGDDG